MKKILFSLSIVCLIITVGCKSNPASTTEKVADKVINPDVQNVGNESYTVDIPVGWSSKTKESSGVKMLVISSPTTGKDDSDVYMNILTEQMQGYSMNDYRDATIKSITTGMPGTTILEKGDITAGDLKGNWFTYKVQDADSKIDAINYSIPKNGVAYIITATIGAGQIEKYRNKFDSIAKSFRIKD